MKSFCVWLAALMAAHLVGCSTIETRDGPRGIEYYPATRMDVKRIGEGLGTGGDPGAMVGGLAVVSVPFYILDIPISVVVDTVCLPFDLFYEPNDNEKRENLPSAPPLAH